MIQTLRNLPWSLTARVLLIIGLLGPAVALILAPAYFSALGALHIITIIVPAALVGVVMLIGAALIFREKYREFGYLIGTIVYAIFCVCAVIAFFTGAVHSVLIFSSPIVVLAYAEGMKTALVHSHGPGN